MLAPTGDQYEITGGGYTAVVTQSGGALRLLRHGTRDLVAVTPEDAMPTGGAGQLLVPWPNRIGDGRYRFGGTTHQLGLTDPGRGNASHGLVRWAAFRPLAQESDRVTLGCRVMAQTGYPWTLDVEVTYALAEDGLTVTQRATNRAATAAPYASGAHPYLVLGDGPVDDWTLAAPAGSALTTDERKLPTGTVEVVGTELDFRSPRPIGATVLDTCFGDLAREDDGRAYVRLSDGERAVELWVDDRHRWLMLFTGEGSDRARKALAVEPMTAPVDAFRSGTDLLTLQPGETVAARWGVRAGRA